MHEIGILFRDRVFEHDIYELVRAFYPGMDIVSLYEEEEREEVSFLFLEIRQDSGEYHILWQDLKNQDRASLTVEMGEEGLSRKEKKDRLKKNLYAFLSKRTGTQLPWGDLTGIRPVKLVMAMLEEGKSDQEALEEFQRDYLVSPQKAELSLAIAKQERELLGGFDVASGYSLYLGIPFCPSICLYCSFSSSPLKKWEGQVEAYLSALFHEMEAVGRIMKETGKRLDTIYIGGGTPTTLSPNQLSRLFAQLERNFGFDGLKEFTLEAGRPDSITREKLQAINAFPVTRISVNPQTMNQVTLDLIGRHHTVEETCQAFALCREQGFDNINMDMIVGLPGEGKDMVTQTLRQIKALGPDSLTVHTLALKRAAALNMFRDRYRDLTYESSQEILELSMEAARDMGMSPYYLYRQKNMKGNFENVGYAAPKKAGLYNILIMEERQSIVAIGAGGACKLTFDGGQRIERVENVKDVANYIARTDEMIERKCRYLEMLRG